MVDTNAKSLVSWTKSLNALKQQILKNNQQIELTAKHPLASVWRKDEENLVHSPKPRHGLHVNSMSICKQQFSCPVLPLKLMTSWACFGFKHF